MPVLFPIRRILPALVAALLFPAGPGAAAGTELGPPLFVAHAGGAVNGHTYTNSLEALESNYRKGHRFFEMDLSWTSDGYLVAIHDWGNESDTFRRMFYVPDDCRVPSKSQFLNLESRYGLTQLCLEDALKWAEEKGDAFIITDIKENNIKGLSRIRTVYGRYVPHVIPQIYRYKTYGEAIRLGYRNIILTLYRMKIDPYRLVSFVRNNRLFAVTMPWRTAQSGLASLLQKYGVNVYAHTVNDLQLFFALKKTGVAGIYTDEITPP